MFEIYKICIPLHRSKLKFAVFRTINFRVFFVIFTILFEFSFKSVILAAIFIEFCKNCGKLQMIVKILCILQNLRENI